MEMEIVAIILFTIIFFGIRIFGAIYCAQKSDKLNRSASGWAIFGLFFPIIAMVWISILKKNITWHKNIDKIDNK